MTKFVTFFASLWAVVLIGQQPIAQYNNVPLSTLSNTETAYYASFLLSQEVQSAQLVSTQNFISDLSDGQISLQLPNMTTATNFYEDYSEYVDANNYFWLGFAKDQDGYSTSDYAIMAVRNGRNIGEFSIGTEHYSIQYINNSSGILLKYFDNYDDSCNPPDSDPEILPRPICSMEKGACNIKILVVIPPALHGKKPLFTDQCYIETGKLNTTLSNSKVKHRVILLGVEEFANDPNIPYQEIYDPNGIPPAGNYTHDILAAYMGPGNPIGIINSNFGADLIIALAEFKSTSPNNWPPNLRGVASSQPADGLYYWAGIRHTSLNTRFHTFAHEIGHLLGAGHEDDHEPSLAKKILNTGNVISMMHTMTNAVLSNRVFHFSNPDVNYQNRSGQPTGDYIPLERFNACVIQNNGCAVGKIGDAIFPDDCDFSLETKIESDCNGNLLMNAINKTDICNGQGYTFLFEFSCDGVNFTPICNSSSPQCTLSLVNLCPNPPWISWNNPRKIYIRLKVFYLNNLVAIDFRRELFYCIQRSRNTETQQYSSNIANEIFYYYYQSNGEKNINASLLNSNGQIISTWSQSLNSAFENKLSLYTAQLSSGIYYLKLNGSKNSQIISFIKQ